MTSMTGNPIQLRVLSDLDAFRIKKCIEISEIIDELLTEFTQRPLLRHSHPFFRPALQKTAVSIAVPLRQVPKVFVILFGIVFLKGEGEGGKLYRDSRNYFRNSITQCRAMIDKRHEDHSDDLTRRSAFTRAAFLASLSMLPSRLIPDDLTG